MELNINARTRHSSLYQRKIIQFRQVIQLKRKNIDRLFLIMFFTFKTKSDSSSLELIRHFITNFRLHSLRGNHQIPSRVRITQVQVGPGSTHSRSGHTFELGRSVFVSLPPKFFEKFSVFLLLTFVLLKQNVFGRFASWHRVWPFHRSPIGNLVSGFKFEIVELFKIMILLWYSLKNDNN